MTLVQTALQLCQSSRFEEARKSLKKYLKKNPSDIQALSLMGEIEVKLGNFRNAGDSLEKILSYIPNNTDALNKLAYIYDKLDLKHKALKCLSRSLGISPGDYQAHYAIACIYKEKKDYEKAKEHYNKALSLNPKFREAYNNLANILDDEGHINDALDCLAKAIEIDPGYLAAYINTGRLLIKAGEYSRAIVSLKKALDISPDNEDVHYYLGSAFLETGQNDYCIMHFQTLMKMNPTHRQGKVKLAGIYVQIGWFEKSHALCMELLEEEPNLVEAKVCLAKEYILKSKYEKAYELIEPLARLKKPPLVIVQTFSSLCLHYKREDKAIDLLEHLAVASDKNLPAFRSKHYSLGSLYESIGNYKKAFYHFKVANDSKPRTDIVEITRQKLDSIIDVYHPDFVNNHVYKGHKSEAPVFIVGMPRSGTSLVEQIIASHPQAYGAGELTYIGAVINNLTPDSDDYPECVKHVSPSILEGIADGYIRHISTLAGNERIVVDKMPLNYHHLGFIRILFPKAKIIHCKRNPMDTCLSCYMMDFAARQPFSNNLDDLGEYYKLYLKQMQYWKDVVKIPILDIQYEELVDNQEEISHKIISYCGLDWDDACLSFHKNKRVTLTASNQQVNKPIYKKSVERWRNYEEDLTPLIKTLGTTG